MACSVVARYRIRLSPASGLDRMGGVDICFFIAWNATSHSSVHSNFVFPRSKLKKGTHLPVDFEMNLLSAAILPVRLCTSLCFYREGMSISAFILLWSILIRDFLYTRAFYNEIGQSLALDSGSWVISYLKLSELDGPLQ